MIEVFSMFIEASAKILVCFMVILNMIRLLQMTKRLFSIKKENEKKEYKEYKEAILCAVGGIIIFVGSVFIAFYLMH